jgi:hypothetical protein
VKNQAMKNKSILQITAIEPIEDPVTAKGYYRWLEDARLPEMFEYPGFKKIMNCKLTTRIEPTPPLVNDYPEHLIITEFFSLKDLEKFSQIPGALGLKEQKTETWNTAIDRKKLWSVTYQETITYKRKVEKKDNRVIQIVSCVTPSDPETAERFYRWYDYEHTPDVFQNEGMVKASGYRRIETEMPVKPLLSDYPYHLAIFEFKSRNILDEIMAGFIKGDPPELGGWGPEIGRKKVWLATYEVVKSWER